MPSGAGQFSLHALGAIAVACPRLRAIGVPALPPVVRVQGFGQVETLLPIRTLLLRRRRTIADFDPPTCAVRAEPGVVHVP